MNPLRTVWVLLPVDDIPENVLAAFTATSQIFYGRQAMLMEGP